MNLTLNLALWIIAGLLAVVFLVSSAKLFVPKEKMAGMSASSRWVEDFSPGALTHRQLRHVQRDLHRPLRRRPNR